jgi:hypothetical protein
LPIAARASWRIYLNKTKVANKELNGGPERVNTKWPKVLKRGEVKIVSKKQKGEEGKMVKDRPSQMTPNRRLTVNPRLKNPLLTTQSS